MPKKPKNGEKKARFLEKALAFSKDHIFIFDGEGRFVYINPAGVEALGIGSDELIGKRWADIKISKESREPFDIRLNAVYAAKKPFKGIIEYSFSGSRKDFEYTLNPIIADGDNLRSAAIEAL